MSGSEGKHIGGLSADSTPLAGLRVIELGHLISGPFAGQILGDLGAEVIKCEPLGGDPMRVWGTDRSGGAPLWFAVLARNKKSVTLDLHKPEGQKLLRGLASVSDVILENFKPGTMESWNLGYEELAELNPGLIMVRITGFGQTGPYASRPGYGSIGEAMGGLRYVVGDPDRPPSRVGISIGDSLAGMYAVIGALTALHERNTSGRGQVVDTAIYEAVLGVMESLVIDYQQAGHIRERTGSILPGLAPSNVYPTLDGEMLLIAANQDTIFRRLAEAIDRPELAEEPRFSTHVARGDHQLELDRLLSDWTKRHRAEELEYKLEKHGVPVGRIYTAAEMFEDAHYTARQSIIHVQDQELGTLAMQNVVPRLSRTPGLVRVPGPRLGQHNDEVFTQIVGLSRRALSGLRERGVI